MQKWLLILIFGWLAAHATGQQFASNWRPDTLHLTDRVGGNRLDSVDLYYTTQAQTTPGGPAFQLFGSNQQQFDLITSRMSNPFELAPARKNTFSALPHIGVSYTFGSRGAQFMHAEYQHQLKPNTSLQMVMEQQSIGAILRHGDARHGDVYAVLTHRGKRYQAQLDARYQYGTVNYNNGLNDTVSANEFGLQFLAVNNAEAFAKTIQSRVGTAQLINFLKDSSRMAGIVVYSQWMLQNREFRDSLSMSSKYSTFYIDSFKTRDQFQLAEWRNAGGLYLGAKRLRAELLYAANYRDYQNLGQHLDTLESEARLHLSYLGRNWYLRQEAFVNVQGALGEWGEKLEIKGDWRNWNLAINGKLEARLPDPFQRKYRSNAWQWYRTDLRVQQRHEAEIRIGRQHVLKPYLGVKVQSWRDTWWLTDSSWRNDTLQSLGLARLDAGLELPYKSFSLVLRGTRNLNPAAFAYLPEWDLRARLVFRKKLFKAKKFDYFFALDFRYQTEHTLMRFDPVTGLYRLPEPGVTAYRSDFAELDVVTGFQIDEFRFYVKYENLEYFWLNKDIRVLQSYPIAPRMLRVGLTWDFFN